METKWRRRALDFLGKRYEKPPFLLAKLIVPPRFGLRFGYGVPGPKMGHIGESPCFDDHGGRSTMTGPQWALASSGRQVGAKDVLVQVGLTSYSASMALN